MTLAHLALAVRSQEKSRRFYEQHFGFDHGPSNVLGNGVLFIRNSEGFELALAETAEPAPMPPFVHFGFRLTDAGEVRAAKARVDADGFEISDEEEDSDSVSFKCRDPDGYLVEVYSDVG